MAQPLATSTLSLDDLCVNTIRTLSMDAVQTARSGHPGTPMGLAPVCYVLWTKHLRYHPLAPDWPDRDRFVLSCGHASMLLYSLLHLTGYDLSLEDLKHFRKLGSKTPGHPEFGVTPGVETTTGPLGQGMANAAGMALAEAHLGAVFNRPGHTVVDHFTYFLASDGDMMEGISHEIAGLAGHLGLGKLIGIYDDNGITIDGSTALTFSDDTGQRFEGYGWHTVRVSDGNDLGDVDRALTEAKAVADRPSLIIVRTHIAYGSPNKQDTSAAHGAPLGQDEIDLTKKSLGWPSLEPFFVPPEAAAQWGKCRERGAALHRGWQEQFEVYRTRFPTEAKELERRLAGELPTAWEESLPSFDPSVGAVATRGASHTVINALAPKVPELIGGAADLAASVKSTMENRGTLSGGDYAGRNINFGVREHGMGGIMNGMTLHGGVRPYGGTFLIFSDYMRPAIRLAAMMARPVIYLFSHDSIGLGEDGPTHQPVETLAALRVIPGLTVIRPADANETAEAWRVALGHTSGPVALILTRQSLPVLDRRRFGPAAGLERGGYVLAEAEGANPSAIIMASGSEVELALSAQTELQEEGIPVRVVSMPSLELFEGQEEAYRRQVLPPEVRPRLAVEAAHPMSWYRWVGDGGDVLGIDRFGASGPYEEVYRSVGLTTGAIVSRVKSLIHQ